MGGSLTQPQLTSTYVGLGTGGYISSSQLISSIAGLSFGAGVTGAQLYSTVASLNTGLPSATIINVSSLNAQSVSAPQALFSSLTVNALTIGTGTGLINMGDIVPTSVSTLQIRAGSNYAAKLFLGTASTNTAIQFYGLTGSYSNTVIAEMSISTATTTTGLQELLLFKGSTTSDSIRLRTTGNLVFEAGAISSVMWPNAVANSTPTMIITNSSFVGILVSTPQVALDVGGQVRAPILSTLALNVSTINGQTFGGPIQSTVIGLGATGYVSSLVNVSVVSTLTLNVSTINGQTVGGPIQSTVIGLATTGYISSTQLTSTVANIQSSLGAGGVTQPQLASTFVGLASGGYVSSSQLFSSIASLNFGAGVTGGQLYSTVASLLTGLPSATLINVSALNAQNVSAPQAFISSLIVQNISAPQATISSLTVNALTIGSGGGFLSFGDIIATSLSTTNISAATLVAGTTQTSSVLIGFNSTMNTIQFYGLGQYKNTAISEQSTGTGLQELLLFKGSSVSDRIRLTTTGSLVFEAGIAAQTFSNNPAQATPTMIINTSSNVGIQTASPATTLDVAGTTRSQIVSTLALNVSTINGQTFGGPIQSTVIGLGLVGYISSSQLFSSLSGLVVGSTLGLSAGSVTAPLLSTLNINLCTINGQTFGGPIQSTVIGLGLTGYISSTQLFSTVTGLGSGTGGGTSGSSIGVSTGQITAVSLSTLRIVASSITASNATFSTLTTNSLTIGTGLGYLSLPPIQTTVISSIAAYGNVMYYTSTFLGNASSQTAIQFFGLNGLYTNTAIAEQSTGAGLQELLLFKGSSVSDRIRLTTTGNLIFEAGIAAQTFSNNPAQATPTMIINSSSNVGIQTASPATTLDVAGTTRSQIISTLNLNVSSINGQATFGSGGAGTGSSLTVSTGALTATILSSLTLNVCTINTFSSLKVSISSLQVNSLLIGTGTGFVVFGDLYTNSLSTGSLMASTMSTLNINVCTINGQTFGGPIQSTMIGLGTSGYISSTQLYSTVAGIGTGGGGGGLTAAQLTSTFTGLGTGGYISSTQLYSTVAGIGTGGGGGGVTSPQLTSTVTSLQNSIGSGGVGVATQTQLASTFEGLGSGGYISSSQLYSTVAGIGTGGGGGGGGGITTTQLTSTVTNLGNIYLSAPLVLFGISSAGVVTSTIYAVNANFGTVSLSTVQFQASSGFITFNDFQPNSVSTQIVYTSTLIAFNQTTCNAAISNIRFSTFSANPGFLLTTDIQANSISTPFVNAATLVTSQISTTVLTASVVSAGVAYFSSLNMLYPGFISLFPDTQMNSISTNLIYTSSLLAANVNTGSIQGSNIQFSSVTFSNIGFLDTQDVRTTSLSTLAVFTSSLVTGYVSTSVMQGLSLLFSSMTFAPGGFVDMQDVRANSLSTQAIYTSSIVNTYLSTSVLQALNLTFSSVTFSNIGFLDMQDVRTTSLSTQVLYTSTIVTNTFTLSTLFANTALIGFSTGQNSIRFFGYTSSFANTVISEQVTSATSQELLIFRGSSISDQIRLQTTGSLVFETGVPANLFPSTNQLAIPTVIITPSSMNVTTALQISSLNVNGLNITSDQWQGSTNYLSVNRAQANVITANSIYGAFIGDGSQLTGIYPGSQQFAPAFGSTIGMSTGSLRSGGLYLGVLYI